MRSKCSSAPSVVGFAASCREPLHLLVPLHEFRSLTLNELASQAIAGPLIDHVEADLLGCRGCRVQTDGAAEFTDFEMTFH